MSTPNVTNISSDDEDDEIEVLEFRKLTQDLIDNPTQPEEKKNHQKTIRCRVSHLF